MIKESDDEEDLCWKSPAPTTEHELSSLFERVGRVVFVRVMRDRDTGRPKGFGFVEMGDGEAEQAIQQLNGVDLHGYALAITEARPRPESLAGQGIPPSRLFVGNLPYDATGAELKELFSSIGPVASAFSLSNGRAGSRGGLPLWTSPIGLTPRRLSAAFTSSLSKGER